MRIPCFGAAQFVGQAVERQVVHGGGAVQFCRSNPAHSESHVKIRIFIDFLSWHYFCSKTYHIKKELQTAKKTNKLTPTKNKTTKQIIEYLI